MSKSKAPRRAYRPKLALIPMMREKRDDIAGKIAIAVETFLTSPSRESFDPVCRWLLTLTIAFDQISPTPINKRKDQASLALILANEVCEAIDQRCDRTGKVGVSGDDMRDLRAAVAVVEEFLSKIPFNVWLAAQRVEAGMWREILADRARYAANEARALLARSEALKDEATSERDRWAGITGKLIDAPA